MGALFGGLALLVPHLSPRLAYSLAAILIAGGWAMVFLFECVAYERQEKAQGSARKTQSQP
jgi:uncharacterized membrane protein